MKQTYSVNIGGRAYNIDADAYGLLDRYLGDISSRISEYDTETMEDIETRIADIFDERITSEMQVVNIETVRRTIAIIGRPETFGEQKRGFSYQHDSTSSNRSKRLYRSSINTVIGGVCGGIAEYFDIDPNVVRLIAVLLFFFGGLSLWVYIIMWIVLPRAPHYVK
jgi:phage shock protein PspC (stress-responsive transcriptional regulator)